MYNVGYTALFIALFKSFDIYAINYNLFMLFGCSILVPCHQHQSWTLGISRWLKALREPISTLWHHGGVLLLDACKVIYVEKYCQPPVNKRWGNVCQKQTSRAITRDYIPQIQWDVVTCPCHWYLLLAHKSSHVKYDLTRMWKVWPRESQAGRA